MLPSGLTYPINWPLSYIARNSKKYRCIIKASHLDIEDVYYTIDVLEGPFEGERQTIAQRLTSYVDLLDRQEIQSIFKRYNQF